MATEGRVTTSLTPSTPRLPSTEAGRAEIEEGPTFVEGPDWYVDADEHLSVILAIEGQARQEAVAQRDRLPLTVESLAAAFRKSGMSVAFDSDAIEGVAEAIIEALEPPAQRNRLRDALRSRSRQAHTLAGHEAEGWESSWETCGREACGEDRDLLEAGE